MNTNISLTSTDPTRGFHQTVVTVPNDETNNVSCFNRCVKKTSANVKRIIRGLTLISMMAAAFGAIVGEAVGSKAATRNDISFTLDAERQLEIAKLIEYNKDLIITASVSCSVALADTVYLLYELKNNCNQ